MWRTINRLAYRAYCWQRALRQLRAARGRLRSGGEGVARDDGRVLCVAAGRIGDLVLQGRAIRSLRQVYRGRGVVVVGRPEVRDLVAPHVDQFESLADDEGLEALTGERFAAAFGDLHVFYELPSLRPWLEALTAARRCLYAGYHDGPDLAPVRPWPRGWELVPSVDRAGVDDDELGRRPNRTRQVIRPRSRGRGGGPGWL